LGLLPTLHRTSARVVEFRSKRDGVRRALVIDRRAEAVNPH
jgi:hypothetical protein